MISFFTMASDVVIKSAPADITVSSGGTAKFTVSAAGSGTLKYQWYKNGSTLSGKTTSALSISNVSSSNVGYYQVKVYNATGSNWSRKAYLKLAGSTTSTTGSTTTTSGSTDIVITKQATSYSRKTGEDLWAPVYAKGSGTLKYQWYKGTTAINKTNYGLWLGDVTKANAGQYRVKISNSTGYVFSNYITLSVDGYSGTSGSTSGSTTGTDTQATITWAIPTKRENGTTLSKTDISKFRIYQTDSAGTAEKMYQLSGVYTQYTVPSLSAGRTYHFALTVVDSAGRESDLSTVVSKTIK